MGRKKKVVEQTNVLVNNQDDKLTINARNPFVFMDEALEGLEIAFQREENIILWGAGGFGKSELAEYFFYTKGITNPFTKTMGNGATIDALLGGFNVKAFQETGKMEYLLEESFLNHEYVILEELFDAPDYVLEELKDILSSGRVRNGNQIFKVKTKFIICCTNKKAEDFAKNNSLKALLERFKYSYNVKWNTYDSKSYGKFFNHVFNSTDPFVELLCDTHSKANKILSPRIAKECYISYKQFGFPALKFIDGLDKSILEKIAANYKNIEALNNIKTEYSKLIEDNIDNRNSLLTKLGKLKFESGFESYIQEANTLTSKLSKEIESINKKVVTNKKIDEAINTLTSDLSF
jgi:hypothetical protein